MTETKLRFTGVGEKEQNQYEAEIEFYGNVDVEVRFYTFFEGEFFFIHL